MRYNSYFFIFLFFAFKASYSQDYKNEFYKRQQTSDTLAQVYIDSLIVANIPYSKAFCLSAEAYLLVKGKDYKKIDELFSLAYEELDRIDNNTVKLEEKLYVLNFNSLYLLTKHEITKANEKIYEGLSISKALDNFEMNIKFQDLQARCYNLIGLNEKVLETTNSIIAELKKGEHKLDKLFYETNLTYAYLNGVNRALSLYILDSVEYKSYVDTSKVYLNNVRKFITDKKALLNMGQQIQFAILKGAVEFYEKNYKTAISYYNEALKLATLNGVKKRVFQIKYKIAESYFLLGDYNKAKVFFDQLSKKDLDQYNLVINKIRINYYYAKIYQKLGLIDESLRFSEAFNNELQSYYRDMSDKKLSVFVTNELKSKEKIISNLNAANEKNKLVKTYTKYGLIAIVLAVIATFIYFKRQKKSFEKKIDKLIAYIKSLEKDQSNDTHTIKEEKARIILDKLKKIEKQELFKSQSYSLNKVAKKIGSNSTYVSQAINTYWNKSFVEYTNELRINYILLKLKEDSMYQKFKLEAISESVGYKSLRSFNKHFKEQTGLSPRQYIYLLEKKQLNFKK